MSNILRGIDKKTISLRKKVGEDLKLPISKLVELTGVYAKLKDEQGNVITDYTNSFVYLLDDNSTSDVLSLTEGKTEVHVGIPWGDSYVYIQLPIYVEVELEQELPTFEDVQEMPVFEEPQNQPAIQEEYVNKKTNVVLEGEQSMPVTTDNVPRLKKDSVIDGVYTFYDDVLIGARGPVTHKIPELHVNVADLFSKEEQTNLDGFEKMILSVHPITVEGITRSDQNIATNDFEYNENTSDLVWVSGFNQPLPFTNLDHARNKSEVLGLRYQLQFVPVFKPDPVVETPVFGDWSSILEQKPEPVKQTPETPVTSGWDMLTNNDSQVQEKQTFASDAFDDVLDNTVITPQNNNYSSTVNNGYNPNSGLNQGYEPPVLNSDVANNPYEQARPVNNGAYEQFTGHTLSYPGAILQDTGAIPIQNSGVSNVQNVASQENNFGYSSPTPQNMVGGTENFTHPQMGTQTEVVNPNSQLDDQSIDEGLAEIKSQKPKKKGVLDKLFGSFKKKNKRGGSKKAAIATTVGIVILLGAGTVGGFMYRSSGLKQISSVKETVESNLSQVKTYLEDDQIDSVESVEIQKLLNENTKAIEEDNSTNFFAVMERNRLIKENNKATTTATNLLKKQSGVTSSSTSASE
jgi:hypothetical protein